MERARPAGPGEAPAHPFADLGLARRLERAEAHAGARFVEARARVSPASGAGWLEVAGAFALFDGPESPVTQTFGLGLFDAVTAAELERLERFFEARGAPVGHELCPLAEPRLAALLAQRGYLPAEFSNVLVRPLGPERDGRGAGNLEVRPILSGEEERWAEIAARGWRFGLPSADGPDTWRETPELAEFVRALAPVLTRRADSVSFLALRRGEPLAAGALCLHEAWRCSPARAPCPRRASRVRSARCSTAACATPRSTAATWPRCAPSRAAPRSATRSATASASPTRARSGSGRARSDVAVARSRAHPEARRAARVVR
jgi:hypothetical protein